MTRRRDRYYQRTYSLSPRQREELVARFDGRCWLCLRLPISAGGATAVRLVVDHDHATGRVRGMLCDTCNKLMRDLDFGDMWERVSRYRVGTL